MQTVNDIQPLRLHKQRAYLPTDPKLQSMGSVVFLNTPTSQSYEAIVKSEKVYSNNKFQAYFTNQLLVGKLFGKAFRESQTKERSAHYKDVEKTLRTVKSVNTITSLNRRNVYVDLFNQNEKFFEIANNTSRSLLLKAKTYIEYIVSIMDAPEYGEYKFKTMVIDAMQWNVPISTLNQKNVTDTPIGYISYLMLKDWEFLKDTLGERVILFTSVKGIVRLDASTIEKGSRVLFERELKKLGFVPTDIPVADDNTDSEQPSISNDVAKTFSQHYNLTGKTSNELVDKVESAIADESKEVIEKIEKEKPLASPEDVVSLAADELNENKELAKKILTMSQEQKTGKQLVLSKRDEELRDKQKSIAVGDKTLEDIITMRDMTYDIQADDVSSLVSTTNKNVTTVKYPNFEKAYNESLMRKDTVNAILKMNEGSIPVFVRDIQVEDSSNVLNYKETWTVQLEDANRVRHTLKFDMPKFIDDKFMYLNGNKKLIVKQLMMKPIVKTGPDEVQICSNYKKIFMYRYGQKISSKIEKLRKALKNMTEKGVVVKYGNNLAANNNYRTTIEYDELSKDITSIRINKTEFLFNQDDVALRLKLLRIPLKENLMCVGFVDGKEPIWVNLDSQTMGENEDMDLVDFITSVESGKLQTIYDEQKVGKKYIYTRAKIMKKFVPVVLLLSYINGLSGLLRKANIKHHFSDTRPKVSDDEGVIQFANGYLVYDKYPFENSLLMNGFSQVPTKSFDYEEFDSKDVYLTVFDILLSRRNIGNAFDNFNDFMIDPITKEVLEDLNLPTNFTDVVLYANALLVDNSYRLENDMSLYRVRSNEIVNGYLYQAVADAYSRYRMTANNNNPKKISVRKDTVTKELLMSQTVEDYSTLNPIVEVEKSRAITPKGLSGMNLDSAYTQDKRSYDPTMMGILAMSTSPDANCGIVRQLTLEPNIVSARGYIEVKNDDLDSLTDSKLFSPAEMLSPLGASRDDSIRTAMAAKQSKHIIPIKKSSPVLISNGAEQVLHYHLSDDFSVVAKHNGIVKEIDTDTGLVVIEYTGKDLVDANGKSVEKLNQAINIAPRIVKNGAGGFYLSNQMETKLKVGQKFKKGEIIAADNKFFSETPLDGSRFNIGSLQKVAVVGGYATFEDSTYVTKKISSDMASELVMQKPVTLGKNANLDYIVKVGDSVKVGDELLRFEMSFEDDSMNKFLSSIGEELHEEVRSIGKTPIKSKYSGVIEDIKVYSTVELEELSPSLRKFVSSHYNRLNKKKKLLDKYDKTETSYKMGILLNEPTQKVETHDGKVKGVEVGEGVLIEIFIKYQDTLGVGDKITFFTALKSIVGEVIPEGLEPFSLYRPEEEVSSVIAPGAVLARMTPSILITMFANKVLVETKRQLEEIYKS